MPGMYWGVLSWRDEAACMRAMQKLRTCGCRRGGALVSSPLTLKFWEGGKGKGK